MDPLILLSLTIFLPAIGAIGLLLFDNKAEEPMRLFALAVTVGTFFLTLQMLTQFQFEGWDYTKDGMQMAASEPWIKSWNINYQLGVDGISMPLVLLTSFISMVSMLAAWNIKKQVKGFLILFLLLETGMLGVFLALDFFLFYVFWEVMLLPMYFLIGVWGGPRQRIRGDQVLPVHAGWAAC